MSKQLLGSLELNRIYQRDCIEGMRMIPDKSIDMILCDLPYGTTACKWDTVIPFEPLWEQYERVIKDNGAIILTAAQPFTTDLIISKRNLFRYDLIWKKNIPTGGMQAKRRPMRAHEHILVFYKEQPTYNPQMIERTEKELKRLPKKPIVQKSSEVYSNKQTVSNSREKNKFKNPNSVLDIKCVYNQSAEKVAHPTQKPVELFEYLIKTYTNENEIVLDNCMGSGTTAVACVRNNRNFIGFETEPSYVEIANKRLDNELEAR
jgi:site-specific DNA-methyltransferase (adenine-specific)